MIFTTTIIPGVIIIDLEPQQDQRGFFARTFCTEEFAAYGIRMTTAQCNISFNYRRGTVRGMHYIIPPATEPKLVRCIRGAIYDVVIDLRPSSPAYKVYLSIELTAENRQALYIPEMCAHGFQTLTDDAEVFYQMGAFYSPEYERGVRYNDPAFGIEWPLPISIISQKDATWPLIDNERDMGPACTTLARETQGRGLQ
jgi:dTDP-4-dehydrorhamnose 3,5-epimerase